FNPCEAVLAKDNQVLHLDRRNNEDDTTDYGRCEANYEEWKCEARIGRFKCRKGKSAGHFAVGVRPSGLGRQLTSVTLGSNLSNEIVNKITRTAHSNKRTSPPDKVATIGEFNINMPGSVAITTIAAAAPVMSIFNSMKIICFPAF